MGYLCERGDLIDMILQQLWYRLGDLPIIGYTKSVLQVHLINTLTY